MYLDPSFGGMLFQIIIVIVAGGGAILFGMRRKIKALFKKDKSQSASPKEDKPVSTENVVDMMENENENKSE